MTDSEKKDHDVRSVGLHVVSRFYSLFCLDVGFSACARDLSKLHCTEEIISAVPNYGLIEILRVTRNAERNLLPINYHSAVP